MSWAKAAWGFLGSVAKKVAKAAWDILIKAAADAAWDWVTGKDKKSQAREEEYSSRDRRGGRRQAANDYDYAEAA
jgi:hypothetical protein